MSRDFSEAHGLGEEVAGARRDGVLGVMGRFGVMGSLEQIVWPVSCEPVGPGGFDACVPMLWPGCALTRELSLT